MAGEARYDLAGFMARALGAGHSTMLGIRYHAQGEDWAELALDPSDVSGDGAGGLAFGPLATLLDMACGSSIAVRAGRFRPRATLDLRIDRLRQPVAGRTLIGHCICPRDDEDIAYVHGYAHDGDPRDPIALVAGTFATTGPWRPAW